jgi:predicted N-acetyltransferase YhbS
MSEPLIPPADPEFVSELALTISLEKVQDGPRIEKLHERAFGPGRFARTASRLREGVAPDPRLSFVASVGTLLVGSIRLTPVEIGATGGLLLGPLTVEPAFENRGIGRALMRRALQAAGLAGYALVILVGDAPYYGRLGFKPVPMGALSLPGPVDPRRLLYLELAEGALTAAAGATVRGATPAT